VTVRQKALVVLLEPGLDASRVNGIFYRIKQTPGVVGVVNLSFVDRETLDRMLLAPQVTTNGKRRRKPTRQESLL